jgi:5'-deoxynucleotidase YfbR-like HD superfamily hydrolase/nucleoside phosphorylase
MDKRERTMTTLPKECDVAFVVALREEHDAMDIFEGASEESIPNVLNLDIRRRNVAIPAGSGLSCLTLLLNDQGPQHAAIATTRFLEFVKPSLLVLLGISGRISNDCKLGDVVIASSCDDIFYRAKIKQHRVAAGGRERAMDALSAPIATWLDKSKPHLSYFDLRQSDRQLLLQGGYIRPDLPVISHGPICTSPFLVDDPLFAEWLGSARNRNILATDMESSAVIEAAHLMGIRNGRILVIRGISDPADGKKKAIDGIEDGALRKIAMRNATHVAGHIISNALSFSPQGFSLKTTDDDAGVHGTAISAYAETIDFLRKVSERVLASDPEIDICNWARTEQARSDSFRSQLSELSSSAYNIEIRQESDPHSWVIERIDRIGRDFLIANWIMTCISNKSATSEIHLEVLSKVYPHRFNRFCKAMLGQLDEKKIVDSLVAAYGHHPKRGINSRKARQTQERAKAHICYLLGRVKTPQQQRRASQELMSWREQIGRKANVIDQIARGNYRLDAVFAQIHSNELRLLLRTICISLILLEQPKESEVYVRACLRNKDFDSLNRGFHLEYYGDIDYDSRETMNNVDHLSSCNQTFEALYKKLTKSLKLGKTYPLRDVELQTILSLAQHRLAKSRLAIAHRTMLQSLFNQYSDSRLTQIPILQSYCAMLRMHLADEAFCQSNLLKKLYELKKVPRTGWNDCDDEHQRTTPNPESILAHTAGGMLLIQFCLPGKLSDKDRNELGETDAALYSKDTILKMFLCHDLAEAYTGDLTPAKRTDVTKTNEGRFNSMIDLFSTYPDYHQSDLYQLWTDFENTKSINGRIAKEIDALENLLQLRIEATQPDVSISDFDYWSDDLAKRITTPLGKRILGVILENPDTVTFTDMPTGSQETPSK